MQYFGKKLNDQKFKDFENSNWVRNQTVRIIEIAVYMTSVWKVPLYKDRQKN